ncbi:uncharacterized protein PRD47_008153 [Ara ararauna]
MLMRYFSKEKRTLRSVAVETTSAGQDLQAASKVPSLVLVLIQLTHSGGNGLCFCLTIYERDPVKTRTGKSPHESEVPKRDKTQGKSVLGQESRYKRRKTNSTQTAAIQSLYKESIQCKILTLLCYRTLAVFLSTNG